MSCCRPPLTDREKRERAFLASIQDSEDKKFFDRMRHLTEQVCINFHSGKMYCFRDDEKLGDPLIKQHDKICKVYWRENWMNPDKYQEIIDMCNQVCSWMQKVIELLDSRGTPMTSFPEYFQKIVTTMLESAHLIFIELDCQFDSVGNMRKLTDLSKTKLAKKWAKLNQKENEIETKTKIKTDYPETKVESKIESSQSKNAQNV